MRFLIPILLFVSSATASDKILRRVATYVIGKNEGVRYEPYKCSNGHWTIGIGHKIKRGESFGKIDRLTVQALFSKDMTEHLARCRRSLPDFDKYPVQVRVAILDGFYRGCLSASPKTLRLMRQGRFKAASAEYLDHREYRESTRLGTGVCKRMNWNAMVFRRYGEKLQ